MDNSRYIVYSSYIIVALVLVYIGFNFIDFQGPKKSFETITTGTTDTGDVMIELSPAKIEKNNVEISFAMNTHSVDLNQFNLKDITLLEYNGKREKPVKAPELEGHHVSGALSFNVDEKPEEMRVIINGIPKEKERVFEWG